MKITAETIARTIVLVIALLNQIFAIFGRDQIPIAEDNVYQLVSILFTIGAAIWSLWKNNSVTQNAIKADEYLKELKDSD